MLVMETRYPMVTTLLQSLLHLSLTWFIRTGFNSSMAFLTTPTAAYLLSTQYDVYPRATSTLKSRGAAIPQQYAFDFNNEPRSLSSPTVGAYEYITASNPGWHITIGICGLNPLYSFPCLYEEKGPKGVLATSAPTTTSTPLPTNSSSCGSSSLPPFKGLQCVNGTWQGIGNISTNDSVINITTTTIQIQGNLVVNASVVAIAVSSCGNFTLPLNVSGEKARKNFESSVRALCSNLRW